MENRIANWSDIGLISYGDVFEFQKRLAKKRANEEIPDTILFCQHNPIVHFSSNNLLNSFSDNLFSEMKESGYSKDILEPDIINYLNKKNIDFGKSTRGGGGAYIGPGQIVVYPIVDYEKIVEYRLGLTEYKDLIDDVMKSVLNEFGIPAIVRNNSDFIDVSNERNDRKDVWVLKDGKPYKLGGKTIITSKNIAYHGFCFYLTKESISGFKYVNPCGHTHDELGIETVEGYLGKKVDYNAFRNTILDVLKSKFRYESMKEVDKNSLY